MMKQRRPMRTRLAAPACIGLLASPAFAQQSSDRTIRIIAPFTAGSLVASEMKVWVPIVQTIGFQMN